MGRVLVVDDEQGLRDALEVLISSRGHTALTAKSVEEALTVLQGQPLDVVITDLRLEPGGDGMEVVRSARAKRDPPEVIVMTAYGTRDKAREAISRGASFYLEKGPHLATDIEVLFTQAINKKRLEADNADLRRALVDRHGLQGIVGRSEVMKEVFELIERVAPTQATVLLSGESGTGKERVARAIHHGSKVAEGPFVPLNCGAIPENLIESELFGHVRGAFTGAETDKEGLFLSAAHGTLFLDEIGELPMSLQPKLLRVLQERKIKPVGAVKELDVDARILAASNRDLEAEVKAGRFREDLYFRLNVLEVPLPPLRERREDIPLLVNAFLEKYSVEYGRKITSVSPEAMERLLSSTYPGNVRQLGNIIERAVALARSDEITLEELPKDVRSDERGPPRPYALEGEVQIPEEGVDLEQLVENFEHRLISAALERSGGVKTKAAELLGLSFRQFRYKLSKYDRQRERGIGISQKDGK